MRSYRRLELTARLRFNLNAMKEEDLKAIYQFIRYLGPGGAPAPAYVPPDKEPGTPYALFPSPPK